MWWSVRVVAPVRRSSPRRNTHGVFVTAAKHRQGLAETTLRQPHREVGPPEPLPARAASTTRRRRWPQAS
ncbi:hypothetical protein T261_2455 [Streptomyces lydicus]|nr:hypothetical protein T261_2455 [Streptomyces lydicus]